jgi:hypothetical protein
MKVLLKEHLDDLRKSGLIDPTIELMRIASVDPTDFLKSKGVQSAYRIPYLELKDCPPFYRDRIFPSLDGRKYDQPKGGGCRLYVLEPVVDLLQDFTKPIYFVEGEKKAAIGYQAGLGCVVGVGGVWNFLDKSNGEMIPEFDRIAWRNREIYYIPDSDVWARRDLQQAVFEFGTKIQERGGLKFYFIQLPPGADGAKQGLDDFLLTHTTDDLMKLPKITLGGKGWSLAKKTHKAREAKKKQKAEAENEPEEKQEEIPKELIAKAWFTRDLIATVSSILRRFVFLKDDRMYLLIAVWVLATYVHQRFEYMALLWVTSPTKRSGKTRLLEVLRELVSNPTAIWINPTEAILFRSAHRGKTLFLDEVEKLRQKDNDIHGHVMAVLNSGFQKGGTVPRMMKGKDGVQKEAEWNTYGPKVISGITNVTDTIADRSLVIKMIRRVRATESLERFRRHKLAKELGDVVFQLKIWRAAKASDIQGIYEGITQEPEELKDCDDRFLDIVEPLLAISLLADAEYTNGGKGVFSDLVDLFKDLGTDRSDQGDAAISVAIEIIGEILGNQEDLFIPSADMLKAFEKKTATAWIKTGKSMASFLGKLDLRPRPESGGKRRGYHVTRSWFDDMSTRYSFSEALEEASQVSQTNQIKRLAKKRYPSQKAPCDTLFGIGKPLENKAL